MVRAYRANIMRKFSSDFFVSIKRDRAHKAALASASSLPNKQSSAMAGESFSRTIRLAAVFFGFTLKPEENFRISLVPPRRDRLSIGNVNLMPNPHSSRCGSSGEAQEPEASNRLLTGKRIENYEIHRSSNSSGLGLDARCLDNCLGRGGKRADCQNVRSTGRGADDDQRQGWQ